jgi:hypothetical protein
VALDASDLAAHRVHAMRPAALLHLVFVSMWGGLVLAEIVVEILGDKNEARRAHAATLHFWIDVLIEIPLLVGVVATGGLLVAATPLDRDLIVKLVAAAIAIAANLYCAAAVVLRYTRRESAAAVQRLRWRVRASAIGFPFAAVAAYIGLSRFLS